MFLLLVDNSSPLNTSIYSIDILPPFYLWLTLLPSFLNLAIVLLIRKGVMDQYINCLYFSLFPLASSVHQLPSNLVSSCYDSPLFIFSLQCSMDFVSFPWLLTPFHVILWLSIYFIITLIPPPNAVTSFHFSLFFNILWPSILLTHCGLCILSYPI